MTECLCAVLSVMNPSVKKCNPCGTQMTIRSTLSVKIFTLTESFQTKSISPIGRVTSGRKAIKLSEGDSVLIGLPINRKDEQKLLIAGSKSGNIVKVPIETFTAQGIGGKGVKYISLAAADIVINGIICTNDDNLLVIGTKHSKTVNVNEIVQTPRDSTGRAIVKDEQIKNLVKL